MAAKCYKTKKTMLHTIQTIKKINSYIEMYEKCLSYKLDSITSLKRFESPQFMGLWNLKEYRQSRVKVYQDIQDRIEQRINNLIKELKTQ